MQIAIVVTILAAIALAVWLLRRRKVETIETRVYRLKDAFKTPSGETVFQNTSSTFTMINGQRISVWSTTDAMTYSVRTAE